MKLSTILSQARNGEVKNLSIKDKPDRTLIDFINLGLIVLYRKFEIKSEEAIITMKTGKSVYTLDSTDPDVTVNNLPMKDNDVLQIVAGYRETGEPYLMNDTTRVENSIYTPSFNKVQIPVISEGDYVSIIYRQNPTLLVADDITDATTGAMTVDAEVEIPYQLLDAMLHYIGYRAHASVDGNANTENNVHYVRFISACEEIKYEGTMILDNLQEKDIIEKGFV